MPSSSTAACGSRTTRRLEAVRIEPSPGRCVGRWPRSCSRPSVPACRPPPCSGALRRRRRRDRRRGLPRDADGPPERVAPTCWSAGGPGRPGARLPPGRGQVAQDHRAVAGRPRPGRRQPGLAALQRLHATRAPLTSQRCTGTGPAGAPAGRATSSSSPTTTACWRPTGFAAPTAWAAVIGTDEVLGETVLAWTDLSDA